MNSYPKYCCSEITSTHVMRILTVNRVRILNAKDEVLTFFLDTKFENSLII